MDLNTGFDLRHRSVAVTVFSNLCSTFSLLLLMAEQKIGTLQEWWGRKGISKKIAPQPMHTYRVLTYSNPTGVTILNTENMWCRPHPDHLTKFQSAYIILIFPVGQRLCCWVLTSGQTGASHKYLRLAPLNFDGGRTTFERHKSLIIELWPVNPRCSAVENRFCYAGNMWERQRSAVIRIEDVKIMGFYRSAETARQSVVQQWDRSCSKKTDSADVCKSVQYFAFCIALFVMHESQKKLREEH